MTYTCKIMLWDTLWNIGTCVTMCNFVTFSTTQIILSYIVKFFSSIQIQFMYMCYIFGTTL